MESSAGNGDSHSDGNSAYSPPQGQKRQRAKQACEPCRLRKRRCNGNAPCDMCTQFEYKCYFEKHPRKRSKLVEQHAVADGQAITDDSNPEPTSGLQATIEDISKMRAQEANSGIAFTRLLGMRLDPSSGPKLFTFGWNLGGSAFTPPHVPQITGYLDQKTLQQLALQYFKNVHPLYGIVEKSRVMKNIALRWRAPADCDIPDHLLCGLASLGILYSEDHAHLAEVLPHLVDIQKTALESSSTMQPPNLIDVQSWILRVLVLRTTDHPHATWMASCTTMHLVESVGLQLEASSSVLHPAAHDSSDPELRRRAFWVARMLNTWVSFEYGRTRVALRGITARLPTSPEGDYTTEYLQLYSISCYLDPEQSDKAGQWEEFLNQLDAYEPKHDGIALSKANLGLCGYRRLRLANPNLSPDVVNKIIKISRDGLGAARRMAEQGMPWWHVANIPFQTVCVFLAMDGRESLSHIAEAMRALEFVVDRFKTRAMKEALKTARFLVRLSKKRKDEDSEMLGLTLQSGGVAAEDPHPFEHVRREHRPDVDGAVPLVMAETPLDPATVSSNEDWNLESALNDSQFDWNYFLTHDMPAFTTFAPDGTM